MLQSIAIWREHIGSAERSYHNTRHIKIFRFSSFIDMYVCSQLITLLYLDKLEYVFSIVQQINIDIYSSHCLRSNSMVTDSVTILSTAESNLYQSRYKSMVKDDQILKCRSDNPYIIICNQSSDILISFS